MAVPQQFLSVPSCYDQPTTTLSNGRCSGSSSLLALPGAGLDEISGLGVCWAAEVLAVQVQ